MFDDETFAWCCCSCTLDLSQIHLLMINLLSLCVRPARPLVPESKMHAPILDPSLWHRLSWSFINPTPTPITLYCSLLFSVVFFPSCWPGLTPPTCLTDRERSISTVELGSSSLVFMWFQLDHMLQGGNSHSEPEGMGPRSSLGAGGMSEGSQGSELRRASSQSVPPSFSKMSQNARENMGVLGESLKQLFQQQRRRISLSRPSSSSSSSSSVISAGDTSPLTPWKQPLNCALLNVTICDSLCSWPGLSRCRHDKAWDQPAEPAQ